MVGETCSVAAAKRPEASYVASTVVLIVRLLQGLAVRQYGGEPLTSWMADAERAAREHPRAFRTFSTTRSAYGGE